MNCPRARLAVWPESGGCLAGAGRGCALSWVDPISPPRGVHRAGAPAEPARLRRTRAWSHPRVASCPGGGGMTDRQSPGRGEADEVHSGPGAGGARPASPPRPGSSPGRPPGPPPAGSLPRGPASPGQPAGPAVAGRTRRRTPGGQRARRWRRRRPQGHRRRKRARKWREASA